MTKPEDAPTVEAVGTPLEPPVRPHPCRTEDGGFDHDWEFCDESFDHEYGCEQVHYFVCRNCEETRDMEDGDYDDDC
jgi:hypothetical protein